VCTQVIPRRAVVKGTGAAARLEARTVLPSTQVGSLCEQGNFLRQQTRCHPGVPAPGVPVAYDSRGLPAWPRRPLTEGLGPRDCSPGGRNGAPGVSAPGCRRNLGPAPAPDPERKKQETLC